MIKQVNIVSGKGYEKNKAGGGDSGDGRRTAALSWDGQQRPH